jgi:hypothetical protein
LSALKHVTTSCLENLFDKEDLKIEDILDEDEILTTLKSNPEKFGKLYFFCFVSDSIIFVKNPNPCRPHKRSF